MLSKPIIALLALVMVVVVGAGIYAGFNQVTPNNPADNADIMNITSDNDATQDDSNNTSQNDSGQTMITATEAQKIAETFIEEENASAGTPRLVEIEGQMIYVVPVIMDGSTVGQIEIDAYTGKNVGGGGGVS